MELSPWLWFLHTLPESLALASLAIVFCNRKISAGSIFFVGAVYAVAVYLVRLLPFTAFGIHFVILVFVLGMLLYYTLKARFSLSLLCSFGALTVLAALEMLCMYLLSILTGIPVQEAVENLWMHLLFAWPHVLFIFLLGWFLNQRWKFD